MPCFLPSVLATQSALQAALPRAPYPLLFTLASPQAISPRPMALNTTHRLRIPKFIFPLPHSPEFQAPMSRYLLLATCLFHKHLTLYVLRNGLGLYLSPASTSCSPSLPVKGNSSTVHTHAQAWNLRVLPPTCLSFSHSHIQSVNRFFPFFPPFLQCTYISSSPQPTFLSQRSSSLFRTISVVS